MRPDKCNAKRRDSIIFTFYKILVPKIMLNSGVGLGFELWLRFTGQFQGHGFR